jgi:hypothetical protein
MNMSWKAFAQYLISMLANAAVGYAVEHITGIPGSGVAAGGLGAAVTYSMNPPSAPPKA